MQSFPYVLSEYEEINCVLYKPINSTQRIKYTCFNASSNYIVLGSTSGSIYLFSREPCSFLQLIPLSEGAVTRVLISPDEKTIALATTRGSVCLVALKPTPKLIAVSTEHVYEQINCLCWNDNSNEIYIGDGAGKVSVIVLSIFTVNGMFQAPACALMNLDSAIVQLNFSAPLLLASTLTRCYVCDTVQEQYKQIGNKARNGEFGACFYKTTGPESSPTTQKDERLVSRKRSFSFIPESDSNVQLENSSRIFCARPGSRVWEVSANGIVLKTHQFKEALAVPPVTICKANSTKSNLKRQEEEPCSPQSINFNHLFVVADKYLFSYTSGGLYVLDPLNAAVILWCNELANVTMAETVENRIYLMSCDGEFRCFVLSTLDALILRLYGKKRYQECLDVCLSHRSQLENLISDSETQKVFEMDNKSRLLQDDELSTLLHPVIRLLQSNLDVSPVKLDSGIVVVNPGNSDLKNEEPIRYKSKTNSPTQSIELSSTVQGTKEVENLADSSIKGEGMNDDNCNLGESVGEVAKIEVREEVKEESASGEGSSDVTQRVQYDLEAMYTLASKIRASMKESELERVIYDIERRMELIKSSYEPLTELKSFIYEVMRSAEFYYFSILLENTSTQTILSLESERIIKKLIEAFVSVNAQNYERCECGSLSVVDQMVEPKFLAVGRSILRKLEDKGEECANVCDGVPYMWKEYLPVCIERKRFSSEVLRQCLLTRDCVVLSLLLPSMDDNQWRILVEGLNDMKDGRCLFCGRATRDLSAESLVDWSAVCREITKKLGPDVTTTLLKKLEELVPDFAIDKSIFQSLVFTKILYQHGMKCAVDFNKSTLGSSEYSTMCSTKIRDELVGVLAKDTGRPISKTIFGSGAHHWGMRFRNKSSTCPCCTLSLQTPVLLGNNGIAIFCCGHAYHVSCMIEKKLTTCNLH